MSETVSPVPARSEARVEWCAGCHDLREFETPPCSEHDGACPELACVLCGWALIGGFEVLAASSGPGRRSAG